MQSPELLFLADDYTRLNNLGLVAEVRKNNCQTRFMTYLDDEWV